MGVLFWNQLHHPFLSDPCPLLAGPHTGTGAGRHGLSPPFPPAPPLQAPKGQPPFEPPLVERCSSLSQPACRKLLVILERPRHLDNALCSCGSGLGPPLPAQAAAPASPVPPRSSTTLNSSPPRRRCSRQRPRRDRTRHLVCAHAGEASAWRSLPFLLLGSHHVAPSASCIFAPSLRVARAAENLPLRGSSCPPGFRFPPCAPSVRARRARRKAPDGARTYREGERSWKNFTQRQRR